MATKIERLRDQGRVNEIARLRESLQCGDVPLFEVTELGNVLPSDGAYFRSPRDGERHWSEACAGWRRRPWHGGCDPAPLCIKAGKDTAGAPEQPIAIGPTSEAAKLVWWPIFYRTGELYKQHRASKNLGDIYGLVADEMEDPDSALAKELAGKHDIPAEVAHEETTLDEKIGAGLRRHFTTPHDKWYTVDPNKVGRR